MKKLFKSFVSILLSLAVVAGMIYTTTPGTSRVNASIHYNLNDYAPFNSRTMKQISDMYYNAYYSLPSNYYNVAPSFAYPYDGGELSEQTLMAMTNMINLYRNLGGLSEVSISQGSPELQAGAVIRNFDWDHFPSQSNMPSDMPQEFWDLGGNVTHNIISWNCDPVFSIYRYMNEGYESGTFTTIGHRQALYQMNTSRVDFGFADKVSIGNIAETNNTCDLPFTTFPAPGYYPYELISKGNSSWTIEYNAGTLVNTDNVTVTVTDQDGGVYVYSVADNTLQIVDSRILAIKPPVNYGEITEYGGTYSFNIYVDGLETAGGESASVEWTTSFFNAFDYRDKDITDYSFNSSIVNFPQTISASDADLFSFLLNDKLYFKYNGTLSKFPVTLNDSWSYDSTSKCFIYQDNIDLPSNTTNSNGCLNSIKLNAYRGYTTYLRASTSTNTKVGNSISMTFTTYEKLSNFVSIDLYHISNGNLELVKTISGSDIPTTGSSVSFTLSNLALTDSGNYYVVAKENPSVKDLTLVAGPINLNVTNATSTNQAAPTLPPIPLDPTNPTTTPAPTTPTTNPVTTPATTPVTTVAPSSAPTNTPIQTPTTAPSVTVAPVVTPAITATPSTTVVPTTAPSEDGISGFAERLYTTCLARSSDPNGKQYWINQLKSGMSGADAAKMFFFSSEFVGFNLNDTEFVTRLYRTFMNREPDQGGLDFWLTQLKSGKDRMYVFNGFVGSVEWANVCLTYGIVSGSSTQPTIVKEPTQGINDFTTRMYTTCLGRPSDPVGQSFWASSLANMKVSGTEVARFFFFGSEFTNKNYSDSEYVIRLYRTFMGREPDQGGFNYWMSMLNKGYSRKYVFDSFSVSGEFANLCIESGIIR